MQRLMLTFLRACIRNCVASIELAEAPAQCCCNRSVPALIQARTSYTMGQRRMQRVDDHSIVIQNSTRISMIVIAPRLAIGVQWFDRSVIHLHSSTCVLCSREQTRNRWRTRVLSFRIRVSSSQASAGIKVYYPWDGVLSAVVVRQSIIARVNGQIACDL